MYELIARNKRNSLLLSSLVILVLAALGWLIAEYTAGPGTGPTGAILAASAGALLAVLSYVGGGPMILRISGAREVTKSDQPRLFNVVEEIAIASGLPVPKIYLIDDTAPNAFATGRDPSHAAVTVTSGLLSKLNRDELQGVIAHEISHIRNYDVLFATVIAIQVGLIALLCDFFLRFTFWGGGRRRSGRDRGGGGGGAIILVLAILLAVLAPLISKLLQLAISRQREYLADASSVELTRYPEGLASALEKIATDREPLEAANRATQHLYIVNPVKDPKQYGKNLFSTHPEVGERIRRLRAMT